MSPVRHCVVGIPQFFDDRQRDAVARAAELGGLHVVRFLHEPTAAALAYDREMEIRGDKKASRNLIVFSMGGARVEATLLQDVQGAFTIKVRIITA